MDGFDMTVSHMESLMRTRPQGYKSNVQELAQSILENPDAARHYVHAWQALARIAAREGEYALAASYLTRAYTYVTNQSAASDALTVATVATELAIAYTNARSRTSAEGTLSQLDEYLKNLTGIDDEMHAAIGTLVGQAKGVMREIFETQDAVAKAQQQVTWAEVVQEIASSMTSADPHVLQSVTTKILALDMEQADIQLKLMLRQTLAVCYLALGENSKARDMLRISYGLLVEMRQPFGELLAHAEKYVDVCMQIGDNDSLDSARAMIQSLIHERDVTDVGLGTLLRLEAKLQMRRHPRA